MTAAAVTVVERLDVREQLAELALDEVQVVGVGVPDAVGADPLHDQELFAPVLAPVPHVMVRRTVDAAGEPYAFPFGVRDQLRWVHVHGLPRRRPLLRRWRPLSADRGVCEFAGR